MKISGQMATALLCYDNQGHLLSEHEIHLPTGELHAFYGTAELVGVPEDRDLVGQTKSITLEALRGYAPELCSQMLQSAPGAGWKLATYWAASNDAEIVAALEFNVDIFLKGKDVYVGGVRLCGPLDLQTFREFLGVPKRHSLIGDFGLDREWQFLYLKKLGVNLDSAVVDLTISTCAKD